MDEWAAKLASKSPVLMRLGHDAMYRQQDMALDDALEYLRSQLSLDLLDRGHPGGRPGVLREARAEMEGTLMATEEKPTDRASGESPEAPAETEHGEETGMQGWWTTSTSAARPRSSAAARRRSLSSTSAAS